MPGVALTAAGVVDLNADDLVDLPPCAPLVTDTHPTCRPTRARCEAAAKASSPRKILIERQLESRLPVEDLGEGLCAELAGGHMPGRDAIHLDATGQWPLAAALVACAGGARAPAASKGPQP